MKTGRTLSLKWQLIMLVISCWLIPIAAVAGIFGSLLSRSYETSLQQEIESSMQNALNQFELRFASIIEDSKAVSYDGVVRSSYRSYQLDGDSAALYGSVNEYLSQRFSRDEKYKAVYISFRNDIDIESYVITPGVQAYTTIRNYRNTVEPLLLKEMETAETLIRFFLIDDELYMARNLLDGKFSPYAAVIMQCKKDVLFRSFVDLPYDPSPEIRIDGDVIVPANSIQSDLEYRFVSVSGAVDNHDINVRAAYPKFSIWKDVPSLKYAVLGAAGLVIPLLVIAILYFYRQVTRPTDVLLMASEQVRSGHRGYVITEMPGNEEFRQLTTQFNTMSTELKNQFDQLYEEQKALQLAKIRTLQSQINPHFLNNTLEVINWEARMAEDEKVSAMIEALSTMLDAALDRDGRGMIPLSEEIRYVDAYLYIIHERLGDRFSAEKEIDAAMESVMVPRLILQPIVENAVEHDITPRGGGSIRIRACRENGLILLETVHSGELSDEDRKNIHEIITSEGYSGKANVGLVNVAQRLKLIYKEQGCIKFYEEDGFITFRLSFPEKI